MEGRHFYTLAKVYAVSAVTLPPADATRATAQSAAAMRRAVATGFPDVTAMLKGNDLESYRRRIEYADLLWDLADCEPPGAKSGSPSAAFHADFTPPRLGDAGTAERPR